MSAEESAVMNAGPHRAEVPYTELKKGHDYYITKWGRRGESWGRAKGIGFKETVNYDGVSQGKETGLALAPPHDLALLHEGDPLVTFETIVPLNPTHVERCGICNMTHLKPYNAGRKPGVGFKFHNVDAFGEKLAMGALESSPLPPHLVKEAIGGFSVKGGKRNKKKRRKTRRTRKSTRKRKRTRKTRRKRNRH